MSDDVAHDHNGTPGLRELLERSLQMSCHLG
jgi:hypothetical protein